MLNGTLSDLLDKLNGWANQAILMLPNLGAAVLIVLISWLLARLVSRVTARVLRRATPYEEIDLLLARVVWRARHVQDSAS